MAVFRAHGECSLQMPHWVSSEDDPQPCSEDGPPSTVRGRAETRRTCCEAGGGEDEGGLPRRRGGQRHRDQAPHLVARRNARERRRVQAVNSAFCRLRGAVPAQTSRSKRLSKVKMLLRAIEYISQLQQLLQTRQICGSCNCR